MRVAARPLHITLHGLGIAEVDSIQSVSILNFTFVELGDATATWFLGEGAARVAELWVRKAKAAAEDKDGESDLGSILSDSDIDSVGSEVEAEAEAEADEAAEEEGRKSEGEPEQELGSLQRGGYGSHTVFCNCYLFLIITQAFSIASS